MSYDYDAIQAFRAGERVDNVSFVCCECGGYAQGNVSCEDGEICDQCEAEILEEMAEMDDAMDGDHDSAMRDAGWGTDEDYGYYGGDGDYGYEE